MDDRNCGCCEGTEILTPVQIANRPGLSALSYRVGTHGRFLETMKARLSSMVIDLPDPDDPYKVLASYPLRSLTTRASHDASIALLDAWATVGNVLTFYQERIANEGFLRTATERRSILELGRLVGYALRPGVASTVYLAYTIDPNQKTPVEIPAGARSQSVPGPGETAQFFETSETIEARAEWSAIRPRLSRPQYILSNTDTIYLNGIDSQLKPNDPLLIIDSGGGRRFRRVLRTEIDAEAQRTKVVLTIAGEFGPELADLEALAASASLPEEEGPYSRAIAEVLLEDVQNGVKAWIPFLKNENVSARIQRHEGYKLVLLIEQTVRILRALNFELLVAWAETALERVQAVLRKIEPKAEVTDPPAGSGRPIDLSSYQILREDDRTSLSADERRKAFAREIVRSEIDQIIGEGGAIDRLTVLAADPHKAPDEKMAAIEAEIRRLQQLKGIFEKLDFPRQGAWIGALFQALDAAASPPALVTSRLFMTLQPSFPLFTALFIPSLPQLQLKPQIPLPGKLEMNRPVDIIYAQQSAITTQFVSTLGSVPDDTLRQAKKNAVIQPGQARVYALRVMASVFGHNAQKQVVYEDERNVPKLPSDWVDWPLAGDEHTNVVFLDRAYDGVLPGSFVVIQKADEMDSQARVFAGVGAVTQPRSEYGQNSKVTKLQLAGDWRQTEEGMSSIRGTTVYAQSELQALAELPIQEDVMGGTDTIVLNGLYDGLESGRSLIITGERTDIEGTSGVHGSERIVLLNASEAYIRIREQTGEEVTQPDQKDGEGVIDLPGDRLHTTIRLAGKLTYSYKRDTVTLYGNVAKATHGETRNEVLGNGDGSRAFQSYGLKQPPLTFVTAPNPSGVDSTLSVYVNDVEWHEVDTFAWLKPADHAFVTRTDDDGKTTVIFGNGQLGARLPTGAANVRAVYRSGIGKSGNVRAEQINMLISRPLGVKEVINPLPASGGADKESRDQARKNVPSSVKSLDRLVSLQDYADFARTFAGIGKARAVHLSDGYKQIVHLTVAGLDEDAIPENSDLFQNLNRALRKFGDPDLSIQLVLRELVLLVIKARVQIHPDYLWEKVEPKIRARLLDSLGYERRELGERVRLGKILSEIQSVPGVVYVDVELLDTISEGEASDPDDKLKEKLKILASSGGGSPSSSIAAKVAHADDIRPSQILFLTPDIPETLILEEIPQ